MRYRVLLERFTLLLICGLCALALFGLVAFLAIETLSWAIFAHLGERFLVLALPVLFASIFALSLFNLALNQGILADRALADAGVLPDARATRATALRLGLGLAGFVALSLCVLFLVNRSNVREKSLELEDEMRALVSQRQQPLSRLVAFCEQRTKGHEAVQILSQIASTTPSFRDLQLIVPLQLDTGLVFKRIPRWWSEREADPFSTVDAGLSFQPNRFELDYLRRESGSAGEAAPKIFVKRPWLKVFQPLRNARNQTIAFLYSEQHRLGHRDYK